MIARDTIVAEARSWIDVPWHHLGRSQAGIDCVGLVVMVSRALKISDYDLNTYPREPVASRFLDHFLKAGHTQIPILTALPGDLYIFREQRFACHVGFVSARDGQATIIHAHTRRRKVLEEPLIGEWADKRVAAMRLPGAG